MVNLDSMKKLPYLVLSLLILFRFLMPLLEAPTKLTVTAGESPTANREEAGQATASSSTSSARTSEADPTVAPSKKAFGNSDGIGYTIEEFNRLSETELTQLKGIGPKLARAIVQYRTDHGDFKGWEDLLHVKGIGEKKLRLILQSRP